VKLFFREIIFRSNFYPLLFWGLLFGEKRAPIRVIERFDVYWFSGAAFFRKMTFPAFQKIKGKLKNLESQNLLNSEQICKKLH
jgi:hypothetical protein